MNEPSTTDLLTGIRFLQGLPGDLISELAGIGEVVTFPAGSVIFQQGEEAATLYLLIDGNVSLEICAPGVGCKRVLTVASGELLGWSPVLEHGRMTATARTLTEVRAVAFSGNQVLAMCEKEPRFGHQFMKCAALALAKRLSATRLQLLDVFGTQMPNATGQTTRSE